MRKSGLHKQISSIFDGVPMPQNSGTLENTDSPLAQMTPETETAAERPPQPDAAPAPQPPRSSLVKRMSADPSECASAPAIQVGRPMPLPKSSLAPAKTGPGMSTQIKKMVFGSSRGALDARQKKMAALVGILSAVFGVVMFFSLGGVGQTKAMAANNTDAEQNIQSQSTKKATQGWTTPQPLPENLRDATSLGSKPAAADSAAGSSASGEVVVKGILFSQNKPSAIINNTILTDGKSINGITIVKITKDAVEFKAGDKQWTQQVQR